MKQLEKNLPDNAEVDTISIPGSGRSPGGGHGNPLQYSCLENSMDRGAWHAIQSMGSQRVRHDWAYTTTTIVTKQFCYTIIFLNRFLWVRQWQIFKFQRGRIIKNYSRIRNAILWLFSELYSVQSKVLIIEKLFIVWT